MGLECGNEVEELCTWVETSRLSFVFAGDKVLWAQDGGEILE